jgi:hypothetical protein
MTNFCSTHRFPRAGVDPIIDPAIAAAFVCSLVSSPSMRETFAVLLDHERRGMGILHLVDDPHPDAIFDLAEAIGNCIHEHSEIGAVILASVRPNGSDELADAGRWLELSDHFETVGVELVEWFVIGRTTSLPRTLIGDPQRWAC